MKKLIIISAMLLALPSAMAQTEKGNSLIEVGSNFFGSFTGQLAPSTGFQFYSSDGTTLISIGGEVGYFAMDDLAVKVGAGYSSINTDGSAEAITSFSYKIGAEYFINSYIPVQIDFTGSTIEDEEDFDTPDPFYMGLQAGYLVFLGERIAFEPSLRYAISLNNDYSDSGIFEMRFGFVLFFDGQVGQ